MKWLYRVCSLAVVLSVGLVGQSTAVPRLPAFNGWQKAADTLATTGAGLPAPEPAILAEYGLLSVERVGYVRGDRHMQIAAYRFRDASGAYGAFTYYRPSDYAPFQLDPPPAPARDQAVGGDNHILFTRGNWLIRADVDQATAMTASDMRTLASLLPPPGGDERLLPTLPLYMPTAGQVPQTLHYVEGAAGFAAACAWLPAAQLGFDHSAEAVVAEYSLANTDQPAQLAVISYPTPQLARTYLGVVQRTPNNTVAARRSGPMLVVVEAPAGAARDQLLQTVNYDAEITYNEPAPMGLDELPNMILAIFVLCGMIIAVSVVVGLMTGGLRAGLRRWFPRRFPPREERETLIRLKLE